MEQNLQVAQAANELKPLNSGNSFIDAVKTTKIGIVSDEELKQSLRNAMLLVGLRADNFPKDEEKAKLLEFIRKYFHNISVKEIDLAFENAVLGTLGIDANCYENFSCQYFAKVMTSYYGWAQQKKIETDNIKPMETNLLASPPVDWLDTYNELVEYCRDNKGYIEIDKIIRWDAKHYIYEWAKREKNIVLSKFDQQQYIQQAAEHLLSELSAKAKMLYELSEEEKRQYKNLQKPIDKTNPEWEKIKSLAKHIVLKVTIQTDSL